MNKSWSNRDKRTTKTPPAKSKNSKRKKQHLKFNGCMRFSFTSSKQAQFEFLVFNIWMWSIRVDAFSVSNLRFLEGEFRELKAISFDAVAATQRPPSFNHSRPWCPRRNDAIVKSHPTERNAQQEKENTSKNEVTKCGYFTSSRNNKNNKLAFDLLRNRNLNCILSGRCSRRGCSRRCCVCLWTRARPFTCKDFDVR